MTTIEAARIINAIKCSTVTTPKEHEALTMAECVLFEQERKSAPTAEAEPKHGRWEMYGAITRGTLAVPIYRCSECKEDTNNWFWHYCPNCGARMDAPEDPEP